MPARRTGAVSAAALLGLVLAVLGSNLDLGVGAREDLRRHEADAADLEAQRVRVIRETELTARVADRVARGAIPLAAGVDELEPVHRERPGVECAWPSDPPPTFRHGVARSIIARVDGDLEADPERRTAVLARLNAEYAALR